jgi:hypothetical protein
LVQRGEAGEATVVYQAQLVLLEVICTAPWPLPQGKFMFYITATAELVVKVMPAMPQVAAVE